MNYKLLNQKLRLFSISREDFEKEWWEMCLNSYSDMTKFDIDSVIIFYYPDTDKLVVIEGDGFEKDKLLQDLIEEYLMLDQNGRDAMHQKEVPESVKGIISVLDRVISIRSERYRKEQTRQELQEIKDILYPDSVKIETCYKIKILYDDLLEESELTALASVFKYGMISGIRAERSKRKKTRKEGVV